MRGGAAVTLLSMTVSGEYRYPVPDSLIEALAESIRAHMEAYGLKRVRVESSSEMAEKEARA